MQRILGVATCLALAACANATYPPATDDAFGDAVRHNMAAHIISPTVADPRLDTPADGRRAALAIERYRADEVETPSTSSLSDIGAIGGGASGGGDSGGGQ